MDDFNAYRAMCANRLRRLERYKKARSFCNIDDENPPSASEFAIPVPAFCAEGASSSERLFSNGATRGSPAFEVIREKMPSLWQKRGQKRGRRGSSERPDSHLGDKPGSSMRRTAGGQTLAHQLSGWHPAWGHAVSSVVVVVRSDPFTWPRYILKQLIVL
ncbi:unnamed protein product [Nippostrongylus brasiliensis]|uniref:Uncharacterized protein n=1 Tax=Nippostrongylus brasiliensis TaxID=27835 RepID=A0A0N4XZX0_NIPBR|nr:unnamed protein product [Nippostrongylus brasiliensis]